MLGGTPGNALTSAGSGAWWFRSPMASNRHPPVTGSTTGDTYWNTMALDAVQPVDHQPGDPWVDVRYSDGLYTALQAYDGLNIPVGNLTVALRTDEQTLFCDWVDRASRRTTSGIRPAATLIRGGDRGVLTLQGHEVPGEIVVPHVMRQVTAADCNPDRVHPVVSGRARTRRRAAAMFAS